MLKSSLWVSAFFNWHFPTLSGSKLIKLFHMMVHLKTGFQKKKIWLLTRNCWEICVAWLFNSQTDNAKRVKYNNPKHMKIVRWYAWDHWFSLFGCFLFGYKSKINCPFKGENLEKIPQQNLQRLPQYTCVQLNVTSCATKDLRTSQLNISKPHLSVASPGIVSLTILWPHAPLCWRIIAWFLSPLQFLLMSRQILFCIKSLYTYLCSHSQTC